MSRAPHLVAALLLLLAGGCRFAPSETNAPQPVVNQGAQVPLPLPQPDRPLDRQSLLLAATQARSAAAAGLDDAEAQRTLDGKRFEFRIRLGCTLATVGEQEGGEAKAKGENQAASGRPGPRARYDAQARRIELSVQPEASLSDPAVAAAAAAAAAAAPSRPQAEAAEKAKGEAQNRIGPYEAAEGFWIADPWLLVPHCAGARAGSAPGRASTTAAPPAKAGEEEGAVPAATVAEQGSVRPGQIALVQFFTKADPRSSRRGSRPYEARETLPEGAAAPAPGSWELVITGRLQALAGGRVIHCHAAGAGAPPACVLSVRFDHVEIVNSGSGAVLAEWNSG